MSSLNLHFPDDEKCIKYELKEIHNSSYTHKERKMDASHLIVMWFLIGIAITIIVFDITMLCVFGSHGTITGFVRGFQYSATVWPEFVFLVVCVLTYLHFFRGWL